MSKIVYSVVFNGTVLEGFQTFSVKAHMASLLKADAQKMATLFSGKPVVLKRTEDKNQALKLGNALKKIGADVKVRAVKTEEAPSKPAPEPAAASGGTQLSLAPNVGNLVEPKPEAPPPDIDISALSASEIGNTTLAPPREEVEVDLDLSEYSMADPGADLVTTPKPEAPEVEAPDFGLDAPGAVLETLKVEVEEVDPDISGITLAEPGVDLLDEHPPAPEPELPDISQIALAPLPER